MKFFIRLVCTLMSLQALAPVVYAAETNGSAQGRAAPWTVERARHWRATEGWRIGCNYLPATAINQHEMWSAATWDPSTIARELDLARETGFNTLRVYLHDRTFESDPQGFLNRMDAFLALCSTRHIKPIFVFFDDCWLMPSTVPGLIPQPRPGTHNSGWLQSPGTDLLRTYASDSQLQQRLRTYVQTVLRRYARDPRVLCWDLFNEPGNRAHRRFNAQGAELPGEHREEPAHDGDRALLRDCFNWAWEVDPIQPLTSGVWQWFRKEEHPIARLQLECSDIITFHNYANLPRMRETVRALRTQSGERPMICTEYMARPAGSTFETILPFLAEEDIGAINWGFVTGKSQTRFSWGSWKQPEGEQTPWFHDLYRPDGTAFRPAEVGLIKRISSEKSAKKESTLPTDTTGALSMESLLSEMTDPASLARLPAHSYRTLQASSYDRTSVAPDKPGWFANADWSHFIRVETNGTRIENVMMEDEGPGAIVRFWNTWFAPMDGKLNHSSDGTIRIYLDDASEPVISASQSELMVHKTIILPPFAETAPPTAPAQQRAYNLYLPLPYARHCKITYETKGQLGTVWNKGESYYYAVNYRKYAPGTPVRTFRRTDLEAKADLIADAGRRITDTPAIPPDAEQRTLSASSLPPGKETSIDFTGPAAIRELVLQLADGTDPAAALRDVELQLDFDGEACVRCPVGFFFGTGVHRSSFQTRYLAATADGKLVSRWVMPFANKAMLRFANHGTSTVSFSCTARSAAWAWDDQSLHFRAIHAPRYGLNVRKEAEGAQDLNFAAIQGHGRLVGDVLAVVNNAKTGFKWWGEGDEKIYVDGETFPSHFGTGTEDYYGYAHCRPEAFSSPFHAQPYGHGNLDPGASPESRASVNLRLRLLDDVPFSRSIRFDMELWHWQSTTVDYIPTTFFYLRPGKAG